jgi:hypothetical protein
VHAAHFISYILYLGHVIGWLVEGQAGKAWIRLLMRSLNFFKFPTPSSCTRAFGLTQTVIEMRGRDVPGA